jgi:hypothetical protein
LNVNVKGTVLRYGPVVLKTVIPVELKLGPLVATVPVQVRFTSVELQKKFTLLAWALGVKPTSAKTRRRPTDHPSFRIVSPLGIPLHQQGPDSSV